MNSQNGFKAKIEVLAVENRKGRSKAGSDYDFNIAQCCLHSINPDGSPKLLVGELMCPQEQRDIKPGFYEGEFEVVVTQDKKIAGRLVRLHAVSTRPPGTPGSTAK